MGLEFSVDEMCKRVNESVYLMLEIREIMDKKLTMIENKMAELKNELSK